MHEIKPTFSTKYNKHKNILGNIKPDTKIYRVISIERFFELIENKNLVLVKPKLWDDPFENFLSKTVMTDSYGEQGIFNITNEFYGQCWTQKKECDGIWRNYASLQSGVKIQTTVEKLLNVIYDDSNNFSMIHSFIGKVEYMSDKKIKDFLSHPNFLNWVTDTSGKNPAQTLLIKRAEFSYEREVRVLYSTDTSLNKNTEDIKKFVINPLEFIDSIVFAPKIDINLFNIYRDKLVDIGFDKKVVTKSDLYKPFQIKIKPNGI